jgi:hypothetical protein
MGRITSESPLRRFADHVNAYTSRNLTYQSDILKAFNGIQTALAASMGNTEMIPGLPVAALDWALFWNGVPYGTLRRRHGFPSWSWAGWCGIVIMAQDHFSEFDQKWLRERTWHQWHLGRLVEETAGRYVADGPDGRVANQVETMVGGVVEGRFEFVRLQDKETSSSTPCRDPGKSKLPQTALKTDSQYSPRRCQ